MRRAALQLLLSRPPPAPAAAAAAAASLPGSQQQQQQQQQQWATQPPHPPAPPASAAAAGQQCAAGSSSTWSSSSSQQQRQQPLQLPHHHQQQQQLPHLQQRGFKTGVWDARPHVKGPLALGRSREPYFNPEDGPEAYLYWRDLWRKPAPKPKQPRPRKTPVLLEPEEEDALVAAAVAAGVPQHLVLGDTSQRHTPRLIAAIQAAAGRIPTQPEPLAERIRGLLALERSAPGLDVLRIFKASGFQILAYEPAQVARQLAYLARRLPSLGLSGTEPGLLLTAAPKPALQYVARLAERAVELPLAVEEGLQGAAASLAAAAAAAGEEPEANEQQQQPGAATTARLAELLLGHPFNATLLNRSANTLRAHARALSETHGPQGAASLAARLPQLLHYQPTTLAAKTAALAQGLGLSTAAARAIVRVEPRLLTHGIDTLAARLAGLGDLLGLPEGPGLTRIVRAKPALLHKRIETLAGKLAALQQLLNLPSQEAAAALVVRRPSLLCYATDSLVRSVAQASEVLTDASKAAELFLQEPALLCLTADAAVAPQGSVGGRLALLRDLAAAEPAWQQQLSELLAGNDVVALARLLVHREMHPRLAWVLQQQQQQQQQEGGTGTPGEASAVSRGSGVLPPLQDVLELPAAEFEQRFPGFAAWRAQQQQQLKRE